MMVICQVIDSINAEKGGPSVSVTSLSEGLAALGIESHIVTFDYPAAGRMLDAPHSVVHAFRFNGALQQALRMNPAARSCLLELAAGPVDLLHNHGLWLPINRMARVAARRSGVPLITSTRGMLEPWSLSQGRQKKRLAWIVSERSNLAAAKVLHATSASELGSLRALGLTQPIAVVPNGAPLPALQPAGGADLARRFPQLHGKRIVLFIGRLHRKKGIDLLLDAFRQLQGRHPDWHLVIAGPDSDGLMQALKSAHGSWPLEERVTFSGALLGPAKDEAYRLAELVVLPSRSENFGNVVAEAMAYGVPVIASTETPWEEVRTIGAGWHVAPALEQLTAALEEAMMRDSAALREMGRRGRSLVERSYSWQAVCSQMQSVYEWMLAGGAPPPCICV